MDLQYLGFDSWFQQKREEFGKSEHIIARVTSVNKDNYQLITEDGEILGQLPGKHLFSAESGMDFPTVGDWVFIGNLTPDGLAIIDGLLPRKSVLKRKLAGKMVEYQLIASNIDSAIIIQSADFDFNLRRLERYLLMINEGKIEPVILLSKSDLVSEEELDHMISQIKDAGIHCSIIPYSIKNGSGLFQIQQILEPGKTYCLLGSSGVGKTTLLNHFMGWDAFETKQVREKDGRGRHTTSRRQLIILDGGAMVIDTPGIRELGNIGVSEGIDESFSDILELSSGCRFSDCTHTSETDCAVLIALQHGKFSQVRHDSYLKLRKESERYQMSYVEKRRKEKKLSKFYRSVMQRKKKK